LDYIIGYYDVEEQALSAYIAIECHRHHLEKELEDIIEDIDWVSKKHQYFNFFCVQHIDEFIHCSSAHPDAESKDTWYNVKADSDSDDDAINDNNNNFMGYS
jgi:hypothetical protein